MKSYTKRLRAEVAALPEKLESMGQFYFLRKDSQPVYGLQDWTEAEWEHNLTTYPEQAHMLIFALRSAHSSFMPEPKPSAAAQASAIKQRLCDALTMGEWRKVVEFQNYCLNHKHNAEQEAELHYIDENLLSKYIFNREFPLGVEDGIMRERWRFAVTHSGLNTVQHRDSSVVTYGVYLGMGFTTIIFISYMLYVMVGKSDLWNIDATRPDPASEVRSRNKQRGQAASLVSAASFSLGVNGMLDKFGLIDPSTSTVFIGMTLGGTWGFVLDNLFGSDEGFREYLWNPLDGMRFAMGSLATARYGRYIVTIIFDMFFTVILFKLLYPRLVQAAGFTVKGREWIANGFVSALISVVTFKVYANMTRFEWAYPSGVEDVRDQWVSGQTMLLATVIMNMVYLMGETRTRVGEPGINDPFVKLLVTFFTFTLLLVLQEYDVLDPSTKEEYEYNSTTLVLGPENELYYNVSLPLRNVCLTQARASSGFAIFFILTAFCLAFVIFGTSAQSLSSLRMACACRPSRRGGPSGASAAERDSSADVGVESSVGVSTLSRTVSRAHRRNMSPIDKAGNSQAVLPRDTGRDRMLGQIVLFLLFFSVIVLFVMFFTFVPLYHSNRPASSREELYDGRINWKQACDDNDRDVLRSIGLS